MDEYSFYKKSSLNRHNMYKELLKHREARKDEEKKKINNFVTPLLSAIVTLSIAYYINSGFKIKQVLYVFCIIVIYIGFYFLSKLVIMLFYKINNRVVKHSTVNSIKKLKEIANDFNYDIVNRVFLSFYLVSKNDKSDILLKFNIIESLFHLEKSVSMLKKIFHPNSIQKLVTDHELIKPYRISITLDIMKETLNFIDTNKFVNLGNLEINDIKDSINFIINMLNRNINNFNYQNID